MIASYFNCVQAKGKHGNRMATWTAFGRMGQNLARLTKLPVKGRTLQRLAREVMPAVFSPGSSAFHMVVTFFW